MDGPEAVHQVRGARAYIVLVLSLTLKLPFFEQPSNVIFSKRIILLLTDIPSKHHIFSKKFAGNAWRDSIDMV